MNLVELVGVGAALLAAVWFVGRRFRATLRSTSLCGDECKCASKKLRKMIHDKRRAANH